MNSVTLLGRLEKDPVSKVLAGGKTVCNFTLLLTSRFDTATGEKREEVTPVECVAWRGAAETIAEHVRAGDLLAVQGSLKLDRWEWQGKQYTRLKVAVTTFEMIGEASREPRKPQPATTSRSADHKHTEPDDFLNP